MRVHVAAIRKAMGDGREGNRFIVSEPGRGYSFVAPVTREQLQEVPAPPPNRQTRSGNLPALLTRVVGRDEIIETVGQPLSEPWDPERVDLDRRELQSPRTKPSIAASARSLNS